MKTATFSLRDSYVITTVPLHFRYIRLRFGNTYFKYDCCS